MEEYQDNLDSRVHVIKERAAGKVAAARVLKIKWTLLIRLLMRRVP